MVAKNNAHPARRIYLDPRWKRTRLAVLSRDSFTCRVCGHRDVTGRGLIAHHTDGLSNLMRWGGDPFDPGECQTLCFPCSGRKDAPRPGRVGRVGYLRSLA